MKNYEIESKYELSAGLKLKSPKASRVEKYSKHGGYSNKTFAKYRLPPSIVTALVSAANHSLAKSTWKSYQTAENHIKKCEKETGIKLRFPFGTKETLTYIGWLLKVRKVSAKTVEKYMSGLRMAHLKAGFVVPALKPDIIKAVIEGAGQAERIKVRLEGKTERLAVTPATLKLIKHELKKSNLSICRKRLVWLVCTLAFNGSFRIEELLSNDSLHFDPQTCLLGRDISIEKWHKDGENNKLVKVWLKSPKELKFGKGVMVEVFETNTEICPVAALEKWKYLSKLAMTSTKPAFRLEDGSLYTGKLFNHDLEKLLGKHIDYKETKILSHSFRAGLATAMAKLGYSDEDICKIGRWNSQAFVNYVKTARLKRMKIAKEMAGKMANL